MQPFEANFLKQRRDLSCEECDCGNDSSMHYAEKRVTFKVQKDDENSGKEGKCKLNQKSKRLNWSKLANSREHIPDGSDAFRQVLQEIANDAEINETMDKHKPGNGQKPLKSILKKNAT